MEGRRRNVINTASVIGVGALGGFVADSISDIEELETLTIIDQDIVEMRNLRNSIYRSIKKRSLCSK